MFSRSRCSEAVREEHSDAILTLARVRPGQGGMMMGRSSFSGGGGGTMMVHSSFGRAGFGGGHGR
jgi:hypothetical protein